MRKPLNVEAKGLFSVFICPKCGAMTVAGAHAHPRHVACGFAMRRGGVPVHGTWRVDIVTDEGQDTPRE